MSEDARFDPREVQRGLVCMLFDPDYTAKVRGDEPLPELGRRARELLRGVDPRALATDSMRRARALQVILDEYPVSAALLGVHAVDQFFGSAAFRACVWEGGSMALRFGQHYLGDKTAGVGAIETGLARARRNRPTPSPTGSGLGSDSGSMARAPGVLALTVPAGSLAWYQRARERLGPEPVRALAQLRKPWPQKPPRPGRADEWLLIERQPDGSLGLAHGSQALVELVAAADRPRPRAELVAAAIELGAAPDEADELLDDLVGEGLLR